MNTLNIRQNLAARVIVGVMFSATMILFNICPPHASAQVVVIAHKSVSVGTQEISALVDIFTLNTKNWSDGAKITVIDYKTELAPKTRLYAAFGLGAADMQKIWLRKQFSGKATPPVLLGSEDEVLTRVAATPGAVGYISADKVSSQVKVLATVK